MMKKLISFLTLGILLTCGTAVTSLGKYNPPEEKSTPSRYTRSTGSRGTCNANTEIPLTLLAPYTHVGQTSSQYPLLAWYVSETDSRAMNLSIYQKDRDREPKLIYGFKLKNPGGIIKFSLPRNRSGLKRGSRYIWQVELICDRTFPAKNVVASAEIEVVGEKVSRDRLWYDTLELSLEAAKKRLVTQQTKALLKQLALLEKQVNNKGIIQSQRLMKVLLLENPLQISEPELAE